ncbi:MAG: DNA helicase RecQ [Eubacteriaceae bacterium]
MTLENNLNRYFGYQTFKTGQEKIVRAAVNGQDVLGIMPTGGGKSLCYQLPAVCLSGLTLVISPLISLMKDQVDALNEMGIPATFLNSSLDQKTFDSRLTNLKEGHYKLLYIAPERLCDPFFLQLIQELSVSLLAVDEAHCISQWGHDFRPSYRDIPGFIKKLSPRPVVAAYTATATEKVTDEIKGLLELNNPIESIIGFDRPNLLYRVLKTGDKLSFIEKTIGQFPHQSGIIYCATRKAVESVTQKLLQHKILAAAYHGGMSPESRAQNQHNFINDAVDVMVATNAFGMGINKPDVRFIIHYNMPQNMEAYYQEAGRGGRDGEICHCTILYSPADIIKQKQLISLNNTSPERERLLYENLQYLVDYCHTDDCLRKKILEYFGETAEYERCGHCGNCLDQTELVDITLEAQKILSCIYRMKNRFGLNMVIAVLRGSKNKRVVELGFESLSTYGIMKEYRPEYLREMLMVLVAKGYIMLTADDYPVLKLTGNASRILKGREQVFHKQQLIEKLPAMKENQDGRNAGRTAIPENYNHELFESLRSLRSEIAKARGLPPYVIFPDASLKEMSAYFPMDQQAFLLINGAGQKRLESYGELFIEVIKSYANDHPDQVKERPKVVGAVANELKTEKKKIQHPSKMPSHFVTLEMYRQGNVIPTIAQERGFTEATILGHLCRCHDEGEVIDWSGLVKDEHEAKVLEVIKQVGHDGLKGIKERLPNDYSYGEIKIVIYKNGLKKGREQ